MSPTDFSAQVVARPGRVILFLRGELDLAGLPALDRACARVEGSSTVVVDLTDLAFMDCAGLGRLLHLHNTVADAGGSVAVVGAQGGVARLMELTGTLEVLAPPFRVQIDPDCVHLSEVLDGRTVRTAEAAFDVLRDQPKMVIELSRLRGVDATGMQLLIDLRSDCLMRGAEIEFTGIPDHVELFLLQRGVRLNLSSNAPRGYAKLRASEERLLASRKLLDR